MSSDDVGIYPSSVIGSVCCGWHPTILINTQSITHVKKKFGSCFHLAGSSWDCSCLISLFKSPWIIGSWEIVSEFGRRFPSGRSKFNYLSAWKLWSEAHSTGRVFLWNIFRIECDPTMTKEIRWNEKIGSSSHQVILKSDVPVIKASAFQTPDLMGLRVDPISFHGFPAERLTVKTRK